MLDVIKRRMPSTRESTAINHVFSLHSQVQWSITSMGEDDENHQAGVFGSFYSPLIRVYFHISRENQMPSVILSQTLPSTFSSSLDISGYDSQTDRFPFHQNAFVSHIIIPYQRYAFILSYASSLSSYSWRRKT